MNHLIKDEQGKKYGKLLVIKLDNLRNKCGAAMWICRCDCGRITSVEGSSLRRGLTKSCGCFSSESTAKRETTHGMSKTKIHETWLGMRDRCKNKNNINYKNYGGRGIKVCKRWEKFENFYEDMGERPSKKHSLDRVNNNGNYEPSNCRWATREEQLNNKRTNRYLSFNGKKMTVTQWAKELLVSPNTIFNRVKSGWETEKILTKPINKKNLRFQGAK